VIWERARSLYRCLSRDGWGHTIKSEENLHTVGNCTSLLHVLSHWMCNTSIFEAAVFDDICCVEAAVL
jgi:hypothetical protein